MSEEIKIPKVRMAKPTGRPIQLRYTDPTTGKEVRITTKTHDPIIAEAEKAKLEAKLLLGLDAKPCKRQGGPSMRWEDFREQYRELRLCSHRERSFDSAESRLDIAGRILKPRRLLDLANSEALHELQSRLLAGDEGKGPRSAHTARNYMAQVMAAVNWAADMGWLPVVPRLRKIKVSKLRQMKGRPISEAEFEKMLEAVEPTVGSEAAESWRYILRAAWESGLRIGELMHLHWSDERYIVPKWSDDEFPVLSIPAEMQKNAIEESIPLQEGFEELLLETPEVQRFGWVLNPMSLQTKVGRAVRHQRPDTEWVGKIITRIGKAAGVVVQPAKGGRKAKHASAHDLRRSCAERLVTAGVPERDVARVLRHASVETTRKNYAPGSVQQSAKIIREKLNVPRYNVVA